jgi:predicted DNA-binding transcriptional regulator YafY
MSQAVVIVYVNHRGEKSERRVMPEAVVWGSNEWHPEPQWLLLAWDFGKDARRAFAMSGIKSWRPSDDA